MSARKLWKVVHIGGRTERPESKVKAYDIYVANARGAFRAHMARGGSAGLGGPGRFVEVWVDERDDHGWQLYERVDLADGES